MGTVTINATTAAWLVAGHLNHLHAAAQDDDGCCPVCCGSCGALRQLRDAGQLDTIVAAVAAGYEWWDTAAGQVDRGWLAQAWRMTDCHPADALAGRWFDAHRHPDLVRTGVPDDAIEVLRDRYIADATVNPEAVRQIREEYGADRL